MDLLLASALYFHPVSHYDYTNEWGDSRDFPISVRRCSVTACGNLCWSRFHSTLGSFRFDYEYDYDTDEVNTDMNLAANYVTPIK